MSSSLRTVLVALIASAVTVDAAPSLSVKTSIPKVEVDGVKNLKVTVTVINTGDETLRLLNDPRGVLSSFPENCFTITSAAGSRPSFSGAKVTYGPAHAAGLNDSDAFTILSPGAFVDVIHDLSAAYNFTRSGAGDYYIEPSNLFTYIDVDGTPKNIHATVRDVAGVKLSGNLTFFRVSDERPRGGYPGCTANDMNMLAAAAETAQDYAYDAYSYLKGIRDSTPRYSFWFGVYSHGRRRIVQEKFRWMNSRRFSNYIYDCNCVDGRPDEPAYVRPNEPGVIYICRTFWGKPEAGADSKAGILIHRASHLIPFDRTFDYVRGRPRAVALGTENPDQAVLNAENYQYFAENSPYLE